MCTIQYSTVCLVPKHNDAVSWCVAKRNTQFHPVVFGKDIGAAHDFRLEISDVFDIPTRLHRSEEQRLRHPTFLSVCIEGKDPPPSSSDTRSPLPLPLIPHILQILALIESLSTFFCGYRSTSFAEEGGGRERSFFLVSLLRLLLNREGEGLLRT